MSGPGMGQNGSDFGNGHQHEAEDAAANNWQRRNSGSTGVSWESGRYDGWNESSTRSAGEIRWGESQWRNHGDRQHYDSSSGQSGEQQGQWFWTPQSWVWGLDLDSAVEEAVRRNWIVVDRSFCQWWHGSSSTASGSTVQDHGGGSQPAAEGDEWAGANEVVSEGGREVVPELGSNHSKKSWKSEGDEKRPNMGKDVIPIHDGSLGMREYQRRVRLFQATTSIDPEYQAGRLVEKMQSDACAAVETLDLRSLRCSDGVEKLLQHLWSELEPLEYLKVMNTLSYFYKVFKRARGEEFSHYDSTFRAQCLRLTEIGAPISGVCKAFWFLEKASISEELRRSVVASAGGSYDYERLRSAVCAIVPQVRREVDEGNSGGKPGGKWHSQSQSHGRGAHKVHAVSPGDDDGEEDPGGSYDEAEDPEAAELEAEAQILLTQAAKKRSEAMKNRGFRRSETAEQREARIQELKRKMPCPACRSHGKVVYGHWHSDSICPYHSKGATSKDAAKATFVVNQGGGDESASSDEAFAVGMCSGGLQSVHESLTVVWATTSSGELRKASGGVALSDTCCARSVCGDRWMEEHINLMIQKNIPFNIDRDDLPFRFGDGPRVQALYAVVFPLLVPGCSIPAILRVSVVEDDVPLLVSSQVMRSLAAVLDLGRSVYVFRGLAGETEMINTQAGHIGFKIVEDNEHLVRHPLVTTDWSHFVESKEEVLVGQDRNCRSGFPNQGSHRHEYREQGVMNVETSHVEK